MFSLKDNRLGFPKKIPPLRIMINFMHPTVEFLRSFENWVPGVTSDAGGHCQRPPEGGHVREGPNFFWEIQQKYTANTKLWFQLKSQQSEFNDSRESCCRLGSRQMRSVAKLQKNQPGRGKMAKVAL